MTADHDLTRLLAVEPSPEFVARVRQRVALGPAPRRLPAQTLLAAAAVVACALAITLVRTPHETSGAIVDEPRDVATAAAVASAPAAISVAPGAVSVHAAPARIDRRDRHPDLIQVPQMAYRDIEPQRGEWPVAEMNVHEVPPIVPVEGERQWSSF